MIMAVMYSLSQKLLEGERKPYYAVARSTGDVSSEELCERISRRCGLKRPVLLAALMAFSEAMEAELAMGKIVDLGGIGRFHVSCSSRGVDRPEEFCSSRDMKDAKILYRPGKRLRQKMKCLEYERG